MGIRGEMGGLGRYLNINKDVEIKLHRKWSRLGEGVGGSKKRGRRGEEVLDKIFFLYRQAVSLVCAFYILFPKGLYHYRQNTIKLIT